MKHLILDSSLWSFNECNNFIILPKIITKYKDNSIVRVLNHRFPFMELYTKAKIESLHHIRFKDIKSFTDWNMCRILTEEYGIEDIKNMELNKLNIVLKQCALYSMKRLNYNFDENSIATLIYLKPFYSYLGPTSIWYFYQTNELYNYFIKNINLV